MEQVRWGVEHLRRGMPDLQGATGSTPTSGAQRHGRQCLRHSGEEGEGEKETDSGAHCQ